MQGVGLDDLQRCLPVSANWWLCGSMNMDCQLPYLCKILKQNCPKFLKMYKLSICSCRYVLSWLKSDSAFIYVNGSTSIYSKGAETKTFPRFIIKTS